MQTPWRLLDTGHRSAAENMALDEIVLESVANGKAPDTIRFLQFRPSAILVGFHQSVDLEVRVAYCNENGIDINRRITGGGAIFFQEDHLGWEIICKKAHFNSSLKHESLFESLSNPIIRTLKEYGIDAAFRPRNDIEVGGRKISGTGGTEEAGAFLFQGTLLVNLDYQKMLKTLRIPVEKIKDKEIDSMKERITTLQDELGYTPEIKQLKQKLRYAFEREFELDLVPESLTSFERRLLKDRLTYFQSSEWINKVTIPIKKRAVVRSVYKAPGGLIRVSAVLDRRNTRMQSALISGDFFTYPKRLIIDLEAVLKDCPADCHRISSEISDFFSNREWSIPGVTPQDFINAINEALAKTDITPYGFTLEECNHIFPVNGKFADIIQNPVSVMLLPYCAKNIDCELRYKRGCSLCGECSICEGYQLGRNNGMKVISINSFEDLMETLEVLKQRGVKAYIGCCCEPFYIKHREDFQRSGLPGILVDIDNTTCYELDKMKEAYLGTFEGQTELNLTLLKKVIHAAL